MANLFNNEELNNVRNAAVKNRVYVETLMGIDVYVADDVCNYVTGGMDVASAVADCDDDQNKVIYVNSKLLNGSKELYNAICRHELGHIFSGHLNSEMKDCVIIDNNLELEADAWAVKHGANAQILRDHLKSAYDLQINMVGEELYKQLVETNETVKMIDEQLKARIVALSK